MSSVKTIEITTDDFLTVVSDAIMMSSMKSDTQIIFDGEDFHVEEVVSKDFIRGYVIRHNIIDDNPMPLEKEEFMKWLGDKIYIHSNSCIGYFLLIERIKLIFVD